MEPLNEPNQGCTPTSSNCIIWQGPDIPFINLCHGASITEVTYKLAISIQDIQDILDIDSYEFDCLGLGKCGPVNFKELVQKVLEKLCEVINKEGIKQLDIDDITVPLDKNNCFVKEYGMKDTSGEYITDIPIAYLSKLIANKLCEAIELVNSNTEEIDNIKTSITKLENEVNKIKDSKQDKRAIESTCFQTDGDIFTAFNNLAKQFCEYKKALGETSEIQESMKQKCIVASDSTLSDPEDTLGENGFVDNPASLAETINNIMLVLCDFRFAIKNLMNARIDYPIYFDASYECDGTFSYTLRQPKINSYFTINENVLIKLSQNNITQQFDVESTLVSGQKTYSGTLSLENTGFDLSEPINFEVLIIYNDSTSGTPKVETTKLHGQAASLLSNVYSEIDENELVKLSYTLSGTSEVEITRNDGEVIVESAQKEPGTYTVTDSNISSNTTYTYYFSVNDNVCTNEVITTPLAECSNPVVESGEWTNIEGIDNVDNEYYSTWKSHYDESMNIND